MNLASTTKKNFGNIKSLLVLVFLSIVTLILLLFGGVLLKQSLENSKEVKEINNKLEVLKNNEKSLKELLNISSKIDSNIDLAKSSLPEDPSVPYFMKQIEKSAEESSLVIEKLAFSKSVSPGVTPPDTTADSTKKLGLVTVQSSFSGDYASILVFLKNLESLRRLCSINLLKISKQALNIAKEESNINAYSLNLSLTTYFSETKSTALNTNMLQNVTDINIVEPVSSSDYRRSDLTSVLNTITGYKEYSMEGDVTPTEATPSSLPLLENLN